MSRLPSTLNDKQIEILRWTAEGAPADRYTAGYAHRITARALEVRGYVRIEGRGATWKCSVTTSGTAWLDAHPVSVEAEASTAADALLERIGAANGSLRVKAQQTAELKTLIAESLNSKRRPHGQMLAIRHEGWLSEYVWVELVPHYDEIVPPVVVDISETAEIVRPAAKAFLKNRDWSFVTPNHMQRAARALQALEIEVERRGWSQGDPSVDLGQGRPHWRQLSAHMRLETEHTAFLVQMAEVSRAGGATIPFAERGRVGSKRPPWIGNRSTEFVPSGRLEVRLWGFLQNHEGTPFRESMQTKTKLSDAVGQVVRAIAIGDLKMEQREKEAAREQEEREEQWRRARARAVLQFAEARKAEVLQHQLRRWREAEDVRTYVAAARERLTSSTMASNQEWFEWATSYANGLDPLSQPVKLTPTIPEPTPDDLARFMSGLDRRSPFRSTD